MSDIEKLRLPPATPRRFPFPHLIDLGRDPLAFFERMRASGPITYARIGPQRLWLVSEPEQVQAVLVGHHRDVVKGRGLQVAKRLVGEGLLTSEGDFHLRQRRLAQPAFHRQRLAAYGAQMVAAAEVSRDRIAPGIAFDLNAEMMRLTLEIVSRTLFGTSVDDEAGQIKEALDELVSQFDLAALPFAELMDKLPLPRVKRFRAAKARLDALVFGIIAARRRDPTDRGDLLAMLLSATDTEGDGTGMNDLQLRDEAMTLFLAGHETTANALSWTWLLLSENPAAEARLHAEVDALAGPVTFESMAKLPWTRAVLAESMRLRPPAWIMGRRAVRPFDLGEWRVPTDELLLLSPWIVHRDPTHWPEPLVFKPERWLDEAATAQRHKYAYFPFGGGPRQCIGEHFAWAEGVLLLAVLAKRWRFARTDSQPVIPEPRITLRPRGGLRMVANERRPQAG